MININTNKDENMTNKHNLYSVLASNIALICSNGDTYICMHTRMCVHVRIYIYIYVCVCVFIYIYYFCWNLFIFTILLRNILSKFRFLIKTSSLERVS